jgi:hypothetical protein
MTSFLHVRDDIRFSPLHEKHIFFSFRKNGHFVPGIHDRPHTVREREREREKIVTKVDKKLF